MTSSFSVPGLVGPAGTGVLVRFPGCGCKGAFACAFGGRPLRVRLGAVSEACFLDVEESDGLGF